jgi:hypothetical protein
MYFAHCFTDTTDVLWLPKPFFATHTLGVGGDVDWNNLDRYNVQQMNPLNKIKNLWVSHKTRQLSLAQQLRVS